MLKKESCREKQKGEGRLSAVLRQFWSREFLLFVIIGVINTFDCSFFAEGIVWLGAAVNPAFVLGYLLSNILAYFLNCWLIFPTRPRLAQYVRFAISYVPNFFIENALVFLCYNIFGLPSLMSFLLAAAIAVPVTFLCVKVFAFRRRVLPVQGEGERKKNES